MHSSHLFLLLLFFLLEHGDAPVLVEMDALHSEIAVGVVSIGHHLSLPLAEHLPAATSDE